MHVILEQTKPNLPRDRDGKLRVSQGSLSQTYQRIRVAYLGDLAFNVGGTEYKKIILFGFVLCFMSVFLISCGGGDGDGSG